MCILSKLTVNDNAQKFIKMLSTEVSNKPFGTPKVGNHETAGAAGPWRKVQNMVEARRKKAGTMQK
jgi:hypothetical protein